MGNKTEKYQICTMNRIAYILFLWFLVAISCVKEDFTHESPDEDIEMVDVSFNLFVAKEGRGTRDTKSIDDQPDAYSTVIRNINETQRVLFFAQTPQQSDLCLVSLQVVGRLEKEGQVF